MAKKDPLGIRLDLDERTALESAAAADDRPVSAMARKVLVKWLKANGWITPPNTPQER